MNIFMIKAKPKYAFKKRSKLPRGARSNIARYIKNPAINETEAGPMNTMSVS